MSQLQEQFRKLMDENYMARQFETERGQQIQSQNTKNGIASIPGGIYGQGQKQIFSKNQSQLFIEN